MGNPFKPDSPEYYRKLRTDLATFREVYVRYVNRTANDIYAGKPVVRDTARTEVVRLSIPANRAVAVSGIQLVWLPPPVFSSSTPPATGLASVAFAHENAVYRGSSTMDIPRPYEAAVDAIDQADAILSAREDDLRHRRRSPWYWGDRFIRGVLGFPAYIVSVLFGFDRYSLSASQGRALWGFSVLADVATLVALGRAFGWW